MKAALTGKFVSYLRVSTTRQGVSGLGLEAQRNVVDNYLNGGPRRLIEEVIEVESGTRNDRPALARALDLCRTYGAALLIAKLDRLSRNTRFLLDVVEGCGDEGVVFCDLPSVPPGAVGKFMITQMAAVAELEAGLISARTKAALAALKARGVKLGGLRTDVAHMTTISKKGNEASIRVRRATAGRNRAGQIAAIRSIQASGARSYREIATALNERGVCTARRGQWSRMQVYQLLRSEKLPGLSHSVVDRAEMT